MRLLANLTALLMICCAEAAAQEPIPVLAGTVTDVDGRPLAQVRVSVARLERVVMSDAGGRFTLAGLPPGRHLVRANLIGHAPAVREVVVGPAGAVVALTLVPTPLTLDEVQVTATALADAGVVAQATSQMSGPVLDRNLSTGVAQTLAALPGVRVRYNGPAAAAPIMRGLTGDRVLVLQDGQRSSDLAGSAVDHAVTVDPLAAARIEVVRGPATLLYGNNALGGVVNVISHDVPSSVPARPQAEVAAQTETALPGAAGSVRATVPLGERWAVSLRAAGRRAGDVRIGDDPELGDRLPNTDSRSRNGALGLAYLGDQVSGGMFARVYDFAYGLPIPPGADPVRLAGWRREVGGRGQVHLPIAALPMLRLEGTAQEYVHDELDPDGALQMAFGLRTQTLNLLLRQGPVGPIREGAWGVSLLAKEHAATGPAALTPGADTRAWGGFVFQEIAPWGGGPALQLGGRYDHYRIESRESPKFGPGVRRVFPAVSGSAGVRLPLSEAVAAGVTFARSFRAPTVEELFSGALHAGTGSVEYGTATLRAERGAGVEAVLRVRSPRWNGQFVVYENRVKHYVHLRAQPDTIVEGNPVRVFRYVQDDALLRGAEASLEWAARRDLVLGAAGDLLRAEQEDGTPLSFMPPPRLGGFVRWDGGRFALGGELHHELQQTRIGPADEGLTEAHTMVRVDAALRFTRGGVRQSITLRMDNLMDDAHREATSRIKDFAPGPGRNVALLYRAYF